MTKTIAIIAGEPNSISSEIIFKSWKIRKKFIHKSFFVIGSFKLLNLQKKRLKYKIQLKKINENFKRNDLTGNKLPIYNIEYNQNSAFEKVSTKSNFYIFNCFNAAIKFIKRKKILGLINCPVSKETLFKNKHQGITEFLSKQLGYKGKEVMLIYNDKLSVSPITTHISIRDVTKNISTNKIISKVKTINNFYNNKFKKKPSIAILGLNPHNFLFSKKFDKKKIINKAVNILKKSKVKITGPISPDTSFVFNKKFKYDVIIGMYHDQVLTPFKALFKYDAINVTLGLPFIRTSPDHGTGENLIAKGEANPKSLIKCIKFFNKIN